MGRGHEPEYYGGERFEHGFQLREQSQTPRAPIFGPALRDFGGHLEKDKRERC